MESVSSENSNLGNEKIKGKKKKRKIPSIKITLRQKYTVQDCSMQEPRGGPVEVGETKERICIFPVWGDAPTYELTKSKKCSQMNRDWKHQKNPPRGKDELVYAAGK